MTTGLDGLGRLAKAIDLLKAVRHGGLIYWEPQSRHGHVSKAQMVADIDAFLAAPTPPAAAPAQDAATEGELKPCPFCRNANAFVEREDFASAVVVCNQCSARGPVACQDSDEEETPGEASARKAWNTRAAPDAREGLVERAHRSLRRLIADYEDVPDATDADGQAVFAEAREVANALAALPAVPEVRG